MNTIGSLFRVTTWGESHGKAMGAVIDGCPAGIDLNENELTDYLKRNDRPVEELATARTEPNEVRILSGTEDDFTIGTPVSIVIKNEDFRKKDYKDLKTNFRPGHGDYTWYLKHNVMPLSGGGRASGRECISRLAAGYIAEKIIKKNFPEYKIASRLESLAGQKIYDDKSYSLALEKAVQLSSDNDSSGGEIDVTVSGVPGGIGAPVFRSLDTDLAGALMSIGGVKAVEIGLGREMALMSGSESNDNFTVKDGRISFETNNAGGILSGITNGEEIIIRLSVKPTPSIAKEQTGIDARNGLRKISVNGRHDLNFTPRAAKIAEAMVNLVLLDHLMLSGKINRDRVG